MVKLGAFLVAAAVIAPLPAMAYTQEEADACTPDAMRLCQQFIPDAGRIATCLGHNHKQLSPACMAVFNRYAHKNVAERERAENLRPAKF